MARINKEEFPQTAVYKSLELDAIEKQETNDCGVKAMSVAYGITYEQALNESIVAGRRKGKGTPFAVFDVVARAHGFKLESVKPSEFIERYPGVHKTALKNVTTHHPDRFKAVWADGETYLLFSRAHVSACVDGVVHDWARGRAKRVWQIKRVVKR